MVPDWLRSPELPAEFPTRPPTSSLALMCFVFTLNAKRPEQNLAPNAAPALHNFTRVISVITETPAGTKLGKIQTKQWRWFVCVCVVYFMLLLGGVEDTFKIMLIFKLMFFIWRFCGEPLERVPLRCLHQALPWNHMWACWSPSGLMLHSGRSFLFMFSYLMNIFAEVQKNKEIHAKSSI